MDEVLSNELIYWEEKLNLTKDEVKLIKRHIRKMKMEEFKNLMDIIMKNPDGTNIEPWFKIERFNPITLSIYYLNIRSLKFLMDNVWESKYSNRTRTTDIVEALPEQLPKYSYKYNFIHSEKQGKGCPNTKYWEGKVTKII